MRRNADAAAATYLAAAQPELEIGRRMLERLDYVKLTPARILDAGSGPAPQSEALASRYRNAQLVALDLSTAMLRRIRSPGLIDRVLGRRAPLALSADMARLPLASRSFSMVWSNMALHWAADPQSAIAEFHRVLAVEGLLMFSTVGPDTLKELRGAVGKLSGANRVHSFIDMHDLGDMLVSAGFAAPVMDTERITLTYENVEGLVKDLRATGQTCALIGRPRGLLGRAGLRNLREALKNTRREGRLPATIEVVYGHAWKAAPRKTAEGHAIVTLESGKRFRNRT